MKVICLIDVIVGSDHKPVTVQLEESGGLLTLREVKAGQVQGAPIEAEATIGVIARDRSERWSCDRNVVIGVRPAP